MRQKEKMKEKEEAEKLLIDEHSYFNVYHSCCDDLIREGRKNIDK